jgi:ribosome-binding factor A
MNKIRTARVESAIKREIATAILLEAKDPRIGFVSVTGVSLTKDYKIAHVFVSIMGDEKAKKKSLAGLKAGAGFFRHYIGENVRLQFTPEIIFEIDTTLDERARIDGLLQQIEESNKHERP